MNNAAMPKKPKMTVVPNVEDQPAHVAVASPSLGAQRRLTAIRLLLRRGSALEAAVKLERKIWSDKLADQTKARNERIREATPTTSEERAERLDIIRRDLLDHEKMELAKRLALDVKTAAVQANEGAFRETAMAQLDGTQQQLPLGDRLRLAEGLDLTSGTLALIDAAARDALGKPDLREQEREEIAELATALAALEIDGMTLAAEHEVEHDQDPDHEDGVPLDEKEIPF